MSVYTPTLGAEALAVLAALAKVPDVNYDCGADLVDINGGKIRDLSPYIVKGAGNNQVSRSCTSNVPGRIDFELDADLVWGSDLIAPYMLIWSQHYLGGQQQRFPLGVYVVTSPEKSMLPGSQWSVTGYEKLYLLQSDIGQAYQAATGTLYADAVAALLSTAGIPNALAGGHLNPAVVTFPGDWATKTLPTDMTFAADSVSSTARQYLDAINELLAASGTLPLFTDPNGRWTIRNIPAPATQPVQWTFATKNDGAYPGASLVVDPAQRTYNGDTYNVPNEWVFVQQDLSFEPTEGSGQYTVDNLNNGPSSQQRVGRVLRSVQVLNASGQADLKTQGDAIVAAQLATAEQIALQTAPWPAAWHLDVFRYADAALPAPPWRKVQSQQWTLDLFGGWMSWQTYAVSST